MGGSNPFGLYNVTSGIWTATVDGFYAFAANVIFGATNNGYRQIILVSSVNSDGAGSASGWGICCRGSPVTPFATGLSTGISYFSMTAGDTMAVQALTSGGTIGVTGYFSGYMARAAVI